MKADLYVQGHFWATIELPADGLLAILAKGMITEAQRKAQQLQADLNAIDGVEICLELLCFTLGLGDHALCEDG